MKYKEALKTLVENGKLSENDFLSLIESIFKPKTIVSQKPIQIICQQSNKIKLSPGFQVALKDLNEKETVILLASLVGAKGVTTPPMRIETKEDEKGKIHLVFELSAEYGAISKRRSGNDGLLDVERLARYVVSREVLKKSAEMSVVSIKGGINEGVIQLSPQGEKKLSERITQIDILKTFKSVNQQPPSYSKAQKKERNIAPTPR